MLTLIECTRQSTCFDCDNQECTGHGDKGADCPKYHCDNPNGLNDCEHCDFIEMFIMSERKRYRTCN